jgi:hypothetical protein
MGLNRPQLVLFTEVPRRKILRTSPVGCSPKLALLDVQRKPRMRRATSRGYDDSVAL